MDSNQQRQVIVFPYPGQGHINPLLQLSLRLASRFFVTFVSTQGNHNRITESWTRQGLMPPSHHNLRMASIPDNALPPRTMQGIIGFIQGLGKALSQPLEELIISITDDKTSPPVACIITDSLMPWVSQVALKLGICWVPYFPSPVSLFQTIQHAAGGFISLEGEDDEEIEVPGLVPFRRSELPDLVRVESHELTEELTRHARNAPWMLINTCEALEHEGLQAARKAGFNFIPVAPLLPPAFVERKKSLSGSDELRTSSLWQQDDTCLEWLDKQSPSSVLYVAFGSIAGMKFEDLETSQRGILRSGVSFLWVLRPDLVSGFTEEKYNVFVENSKRNDQGLIVGWSPQLQVLLHPAVGAFVTHCGWNSTFESICAGLPMICWPSFADQKLNCKYIVDVWKIGVKLSKGREPVTEADVERLVVDTMKGDPGKLMRTRVLELSKACKEEFHRKNGLQAFADALSQS